MKKIDWELMVTRRLAVQVAIAWNHGFGKHFKARFRTGIKNTLVYFDGKKTEYYVEEKEHESFNEDLDRLLDNPEFIHGAIPEAKEFVEEQYLKIRNAIKDANKMPDKEIAWLYRKVSMDHADYYSRMWMVFRICERLVGKIERMLQVRIKDQDKAKELLRIFSTPLRPNDATMQRIELLKIASKSNIFNRERLLREHTKRFRHIPMYDFDHSPYKLLHFRNEFRGIKSPEHELKDIHDSFKKRRIEFEESLKAYQFEQELIDMITMLGKAVILRDYRDMVRQKLNLSLREFYRTIGERINLTIEETALLTNEEVIRHLNDGCNFDMDEIERRKIGFMLIQSGDDIKISSGVNAKDDAKLLGNCGVHDNRKELKGIIASQGLVRGIARVINTNKELERIKAGDILIATMTRQDYVPYMRRCKAVVTEEGGVTCHAAIIARELGIPCLVGISKATSKIHDGEIIEVDANKGVVRRVRP